MVEQRFVGLAMARLRRRRGGRRRAGHCGGTTVASPRRDEDARRRGRRPPVRLSTTMSISPAFGQADMTNCDRELIQFAGSIQPHGLLLVLQRAAAAHRAGQPQCEPLAWPSAGLAAAAQPASAAAVTPVPQLQALCAESDLREPQPLRCTHRHGAVRRRGAPRRRRHAGAGAGAGGPAAAERAQRADRRHGAARPAWARWCSASARLRPSAR